MKDYGVVLGGGGAKGGYEVGVWKALKELEIPVSTVAGASVGALNGAMMVQGDFDTAYKLWTSIGIEDVIKVEREISAAKEDRKRYNLYVNTIKAAVTSGGLDVTPLKTLLKEIIDEDAIRKSSIDLGIITFSLTDFKPVKLFKKDIPEGKLVDYLLASSCFPAFKTQEIDSKKFIDGGVYDNIPVSLMKDRKIKNVIAVDISGPGIVRRVNEDDFNLVYIKNSLDLGGTLSFNAEKSKENIEIGYHDTLRAFGKLKGCKYYIMPSEQLKSSKNAYLKNIGISDFKKMYNFLGLEWSRTNLSGKFVLEKFMRTIKKYCAETLTGENIIPAMAEITAEQIGIDRTKVYTFDGLIDEITSEYEEIIKSKSFNDYIEGLKSTIFSRNEGEFEREIKRALIEGKFLAFYNPDINEKDDKIKRFRRFIAAAFPKISVSNIFIALVLSQNEHDQAIGLSKNR